MITVTDPNTSTTAMPPLCPLERAEDNPFDEPGASTSSSESEEYEGMYEDSTSSGGARCEGAEYVPPSLVSNGLFYPTAAAGTDTLSTLPRLPSLPSVMPAAVGGDLGLHTLAAVAGRELKLEAAQLDERRGMFVPVSSSLSSR
jgi:hypothetical protein